MESAPYPQLHRKSLSQPTKEAIPSAGDAPAFGVHLDVIGSAALPDGPTSHRAVCRVPLERAEELTFWHPSRLIFGGRFHPLPRFRSMGFSGLFRRPRSRGPRSAFASKLHADQLMLCSGPCVIGPFSSGGALRALPLVCRLAAFRRVQPPSFAAFARCQGCLLQLAAKPPGTARVPRRPERLGVDRQRSQTERVKFFLRLCFGAAKGYAIFLNDCPRPNLPALACDGDLFADEGCGDV